MISFYRNKIIGFLVQFLEGNCVLLGVTVICLIPCLLTRQSFACSKRSQGTTPVEARPAALSSPLSTDAVQHYHYCWCWSQRLDGWNYIRSFASEIPEDNVLLVPLVVLFICQFRYEGASKCMLSVFGRETLLI